MTTGSFRGASLYGYYWAPTAYPSEPFAYRLHLDNININPSGGSNRWLGFTVQPPELILISCQLSLHI